MHKAFARAETPEEAYLLSVAIACEQCDALIAEGVEHLHVYTLNNPDLTFDVCRALGLCGGAAGVCGGWVRGGLKVAAGQRFTAICSTYNSCTTHAQHIH